MEMTFGVQSSSIVIVYDVVSVTQNNPAVFGKTFGGDSSAIRSTAGLPVGVRLTGTQSPGPNIRNFRTDVIETLFVPCLRDSERLVHFHMHEG